jgi:electron transport complex protein RnfG
MYGKGVANPSFRQRTAYHAMLLGGMAMITSALIVIGNKQTYADIELRHAEDMKRSLSQVVHPDMHTNDLLNDTIRLTINHEEKTFYIAKSNDKIIAVAFEMTAPGYAGPITVMLGVNRNGELLGARVLSHSETPGLGDKIEAEKNPWIFSFNGLSLSNPGESHWKVKKDGGYFDQFTGATITPRAVIKAIKTGLEYFKANQATLLAETKSQTTQPSADLGDPKPSPDAEGTNPDTSKTVTEKGKSSG